MLRVDAPNTASAPPSSVAATARDSVPTEPDVRFVHDRPGRDELALAALGFDGAFGRLGIEELIARLERTAQ